MAHIKKYIDSNNWRGGLFLKRMYCFFKEVDHLVSLVLSIRYTHNAYKIW